MRTVISLMVVWFLTASFASVASAQAVKRTWTFDDEATGQIATGFTNEVGEWTVVASERGKALAQSANNPNSVFNITLISDINAKDVDLSVRMKPIAGQTDQGGGLVWRAKDKKNYYLARYNPLEDNFRLYKVVHGKRSLIRNYNIQHTDGWHTLRVVMKGDQIECYYDGKKYLEARDSTFTEGGIIGLWSKADARSHFDDLTLATP
jgi:hypothetical protein